MQETLTPWIVTYLDHDKAEPGRTPGWYAVRFRSCDSFNSISLSAVFPDCDAARQWVGIESGIDFESVPIGNTPEEPFRDARIAQFISAVPN